MKKLLDFFSSLKLATFLLVLLLVLSYLGTLYQVEHGLFAAKKVYFEAWLVFPKIPGTSLPAVLPGVYTVMIMLFINLLLGGILRARKGWRQLGILLAHAGILLLIFAEFIAQNFSQRGFLHLREGDVSNVITDYHENEIEISLFSKADKTKREKSFARPISRSKTTTSKNEVLFEFPELPFDLEICALMQNSVLISEAKTKPQSWQQVCDGFFLQELPQSANDEENRVGCYARANFRKGTTSDPFILWDRSASESLKTLEIAGTTFSVEIGKKISTFPYSLELEKFKPEFYPGTRMPKSFESLVIRRENGQEARVSISMNEPMRHEGWTIYQAGWGPPDAASGETLFSKFEVVKNPVENWPQYALYISALGLILHFSISLSRFLLSGEIPPEQSLANAVPSEKRKRVQKPKSIS